MDIRFDLPAIVIVTDRGFKDYADGTRQAGAPSGTPTAVTGRVPLYYNTSANRLYAYNGAWVSVALS